MPIVTLTSDWHNSDYYISAVKGRLLSLVPECNIIDISHQVAPYNVTQAAYILSAAYKNFPAATIHILCVGSEPTQQMPHLLVKYGGQYFIGSDNGQFGLICSNEPELVVKLPYLLGSFPELQVFCKVAADICNGILPEKLGETVYSINQKLPLLPTLDASVINGSIVYIDTFSNAITNISRQNFESVCKNRPFEILVQSNHYKVTEISAQYNNVAEGELLALFNSSDWLEIAIRSGFAAEMLNLRVSGVVRIKFFDKKVEDVLKLF